MKNLQNPDTPTVAALQLNSSDSVDEIIGTAECLIDLAAELGAADGGLLLLPENFSFMGRKEGDRLAVAECDGEGVVQAFLSEQAAKHSLWLVGGTMPLKLDNSDNRVAPASLVYGPNGERLCRYDKIHLFDVDVNSANGGESYRESDGFQAGTQPETVATGVGTVGLSVCYDLRFPELYRQLAADGANIFTMPAAFTAATGRAHWEVLLRARAIENLAFVMASGQTGQHASGRETWGNSMIVDPWGEIISRFYTADGNKLATPLSQQVGVAVANIDLSAQRQRRSEFPVLNHRHL